MLYFTFLLTENTLIYISVQMDLQKSRNDNFKYVFSERQTWQSFYFNILDDSKDKCDQENVIKTNIQKHCISSQQQLLKIQSLIARRKNRWNKINKRTILVLGRSPEYFGCGSAALGRSGLVVSDKMMFNFLSM